MTDEGDKVLCPNCRARLASRITSAIAHQKAQGRYKGGRPRIPKETEKSILEAAGTHPGSSLRELARLVGVSASTARRVLARHGFRPRQRNVPERGVLETIN